MIAERGLHVGGDWNPGIKVFGAAGLVFRPHGGVAIAILRRRSRLDRGRTMGWLGSRKEGVCRGCGQHRKLDVGGGFCTPCQREGRATNRERVKEIEEVMAGDVLRTESEEDSDHAAQARMLSHKEETWKLGRSPGSYG